METKKKSVIKSVAALGLLDTALVGIIVFGAFSKNVYMTAFTSLIGGSGLLTQAVTFTTLSIKEKRKRKILQTENADVTFENAEETSIDKQK